MVNKVFMVTEVMVLAMLKDKDPTVGQEVFLKDNLRYLRQFFERVWRIGEDEIKLLAARLEKAEDIAAQGKTSVGPEFFEALGDEGVMVAVQFDTDDTFTTA